MALATPHFSFFVGQKLTTQKSLKIWSKLKVSIKLRLFLDQNFNKHLKRAKKILQEEANLIAGM